MWLFGILGPSAGDLVFQWGSTIQVHESPWIWPTLPTQRKGTTNQSAWMSTVTSRYQSWYDRWCCKDLKLQQPKSSIPSRMPCHSLNVIQNVSHHVIYQTMLCNHVKHHVTKSMAQYGHTHPMSHSCGWIARAQASRFEGQEFNSQRS